VTIRLVGLKRKVTEERQKKTAADGTQERKTKGERRRQTRQAMVFQENCTLRGKRKMEKEGEGLCGSLKNRGG